MKKYLSIAFMSFLSIGVGQSFGQDIKLPAKIVNGSEFATQLLQKPNVDISSLQFVLVPSGGTPIPVKYYMNESGGVYTFTFLIDNNGLVAAGVSCSIESTDKKYTSSAFTIETYTVAYSPLAEKRIMINEELKFKFLIAPSDPWLNSKQLLFSIENQGIPARITNVPGAIEVTLPIPNDRNLIGTGKALRVSYFSELFQTSYILNTLSVDIAGKEPVILNTITPILYSDVQDYQSLEFKVENFSSIETFKITTPNTVKIKGSSNNVISASSQYVRYDVPSKTFSIDVKEIPGSGVFALTADYKKHLPTGTPFLNVNPVLGTVLINFTIPVSRKFVASPLKITPAVVYDNDFIDLYNLPVFTLEIATAVTAETVFELSLDPNVFKKDIKLPNGSKSATFKINTPLLPNLYTVNFKSGGNTSQGEILVRPRPVVTNVSIDFRGNLVDEISPWKAPQRKHYLLVEGVSLDDQDISFYLTGDGNQVPLKIIHRANAFVKLELFDPALNPADQLQVGVYHLGFERRRSNGSTINDEFPLKSINVRAKKDLSPNFTYKFLDEANETTEVVEGDSFFMNIDGSSISSDFDDQKYKISISLFDYNGTKVKEQVVMENGSEERIISPRGLKVSSIDILKQLSTDVLQPFNRIRVRVDRISDNAVPAPDIKNFYAKGSFMDRFGLVLSVPPFLIAARNVKRKTVEAGTQKVFYTDEEKLSLQGLIVNAGFGIKYIPRLNVNHHYRPSPLNLGLYFIGLDLANTQSKNDQLNDVNNNDFIARGSFNLLFLGEFNLLNLTNLNVKIPLNVGFVWVLDPLDGGAKIAPVFGLGINLPIAGAPSK